MNHSKSFEGCRLGRYFSSGWAFFIPYLFVYLLYYRLKWPVNASTGHVPPLLHVYWILHAINLLLGACAIRVRFSAFRFLPQPSAAKTGPLSAFLPWLLLGLLFYIPGVYLEFPADPWEHLTRINHWADHNTIQILYKDFGYAIPYSMFGYSHEGVNLFRIDIYYTGICLLLCWQYFRLARAVGLGASAAFIFVLLQTLVFGNSVFSFYRYYGVASTIYSQIGAVALVRMGLEAARGKEGFTFLRICTCSISALCLLLLIAMDHAQGLGIAALGLAAVGVWRLLAWKRSMAWGLGLAAIILSVAAVRWWPRHPAIDAAYRPLGVLNAWYGFNLLSLRSAAADRMMQILGLFGVANLVAGVLLIRRNHIVGWLTVVPPLALCLPFVAIPFAGALAHGGDWGNVIVFHRMFLAVPAGLALVVLLTRGFYSDPVGGINPSRPPPYGVLIFTLGALVVIPAQGPFFNRLWNTLEKPAADLTMLTVADDFHQYLHAAPRRADTIYAATAGISFILSSNERISRISLGRSYYQGGAVPSSNINLIKIILDQHLTAGNAVTVVPQTTFPYTSYSIAALCSGHWLAQEVPLAFSGARELPVISANLGMSPSDSEGVFTCYSLIK